MTEKSKKVKKGIVTEEDISNLLQRKAYSANTVLALLQEVAQCEGVKIDWNALVKTTATGISNAREYQMLWRHLAYRHPLLDRVDDGDVPLDDDSDLEFEVEAFPPVSSEAAAEAAACVKVLMASGLPSNSSNPNNSMVEAPLTINIPNGQFSKATSESSELPSMRGMNITIPVTVQKQHLPIIPPTEPLDTNGLANGANRSKRKRNTWTEAEDMELAAAVKKYGEGNWASILRSEFACNRTASQLSHRWGKVKDKIGNLSHAPTSTTSGVQISEAQRAAQIAINLALDPPVKNTFINAAVKTGEGTSQRPFTAKPSSTVKSQITTVNKPVKPGLTSDPIRATAVAAGARIATQSAAASLLKAAQAKNAIHIMPTVGSTAKPNSLPAVPAGGPRLAVANTELPPKQETGGVRSVPNVGKVQVQVKQEKVNWANQEAKINGKESSGGSLKVVPKLEAAEGSRGGDDKVGGLSVEKGENRVPLSVGDKCGEKVENGKQIGSGE